MIFIVNKKELIAALKALRGAIDAEKFPAVFTEFYTSARSEDDLIGTSQPQGLPNDFFPATKETISMKLFNIGATFAETIVAELLLNGSLKPQQRLQIFIEICIGIELMHVMPKYDTSVKDIRVFFAAFRDEFITDKPLPSIEAEMEDIRTRTQEIMRIEQGQQAAPEYSGLPSLLSAPRFSAPEDPVDWYNRVRGSFHERNELRWAHNIRNRLLDMRSRREDIVKVN